MAGYINNGGIITANYEADGDMKSPFSGLADSGAPVMAIVNPLTGRLINTLWVGTQAQYDAIATKDANTEYNIVAA